MSNPSPSHLYHLSILTPEKTAFEDDVYAVIIPGSDGYFEILAHHASMIALVQTGKLIITNKNQKYLTYAVSSGFLEVSHNQAHLLIDSIETAAIIDVERALLSLARAKERLTAQEQGIDLERAKKSLQRAKNRIKIAQESR